MRKRPPVCINLYNQPSCPCSQIPSYRAWVFSRGVGRRDFFWLSTPAFLPFPHVRLHGPRLIQSPEVVPSQFQLQQGGRCKHPTSRGSLHTYSRVIAPKTQTEHGPTLPQSLPPSPDPKNGTPRCSSRALKFLPTLDSVYLCSFKSLPPYQAPSSPSAFTTPLFPPTLV